MERLLVRAWNTELLDYAQWNGVVSRIYRKIRDWGVKTKHAVPAMRALAALFTGCCEACPAAGLEASNGLELLSTLQKHYRDKAMRGAVMAGLRQLLHARIHNGSFSAGQSTKKTDVLPVLLTTVEHIVVAEKHKESRNVGAHAELITLVGSHPHLLDFAMERLVMPLLNSLPLDEHHPAERVQIAMQAFQGIAASYEATFFKAGVTMAGLAVGETVILMTSPLHHC